MNKLLTVSLGLVGTLMLLFLGSAITRFNLLEGQEMKLPQFWIRPYQRLTIKSTLKSKKSLCISMNL